MKRIKTGIFRILLSWTLIFIPFSPVKSQGDGGQTFQQFLFPAFTKSLIRTRAGKEVNILLNYNIVSEKMVFEQKGEYYDLTSPETVDTAYIQSRKFIPHGKEFVEVAVTGDFPFYIQHKGDLQAPPRPGAYGTTSELSSSTYLDGIQTNTGYYNLKLPEGYNVRKSTFYWIRKGEEWIKVNSEKQVPKLFPEKETDIRDFIKKNRIRSDRVEDMIKLGLYCNGPER